MCSFIVTVKVVPSDKAAKKRRAKMAKAMQKQLAKVAKQRAKDKGVKWEHFHIAFHKEAK